MARSPSFTRRPRTRSRFANGRPRRSRTTTHGRKRPGQESSTCTWPRLPEARNLGRQLAQDRVRAVGRAVVHDDDLVRDAERIEEDVDPANQTADRRSVVVAGEEDGDRLDREWVARGVQGRGDVAREAVGKRPCLCAALSCLQRRPGMLTSQGPIGRHLDPGPPARQRNLARRERPH